MSKVPNITSLGKAATVVGRAAHAVDLGQVLSQMVDTADLWVKVVQEESTRREEIRAWEATERERIVAQRDVLLRGLELAHDERRENFRRLLDNLDVAMREDDATTAASLLDSITELAKSSPFKDLGNVEFVANELKQPHRTWKM
jgi:alkylated DNA nucleotide flippase Atl1